MATRLLSSIVGTPDDGLLHAPRRDITPSPCFAPRCPMRPQLAVTLLPVRTISQSFCDVPSTNSNRGMALFQSCGGDRKSEPGAHLAPRGH